MIAGEHVEPHAEEVLGRVGAQQLDPQPPDAVADDVEREGPAVAEPEPAVGPDHERGGGEVPQQLVQEGRVEVAEHDRLVVDAEGGPAAVPLVDLQRPRQVGGAAVELVVEPVAEPADRLGDEQAGGERVGEGRAAGCRAAGRRSRRRPRRGRWRPRCPGRPPRWRRPASGGRPRRSRPAGWRSRGRAGRRRCRTAPPRRRCRGRRPARRRGPPSASRSSGWRRRCRRRCRARRRGSAAARGPRRPGWGSGWSRGSCPHAPGQVLRQRTDALRSPALQHLPHVGGPDDDAVGERGDLGGLAARRRRPRPTQTARSGAAARVRATSVSAASPTVARVPVTPIVEAA